MVTQPLISIATIANLVRTLNVAKGATYATANQLTVTEFLKRGAIFAVQCLQQPTSGNRRNLGRVWDDTAFFLMNQAGHDPVPLTF